MYRVERIRLTHVRVPLREPFRISNGVVAEKDAIVVGLDCGGLTGWGESSPMAGSFYSPDTPDSCWDELVRALGPALVGREFASLDQACDWIDAQPGSNFSKAGLETAFWDLEARRRGLPLHRLLGGEAARVASGLAVGLYPSEAELCAAIERYLADGYQRVKIKIARGHDVALVRTVRAAFGDIPLMTDANADYTLEHLPVFLELDHYGLMMFEQPLGRPMLAESARLQELVRTPVCLDESLETLADVGEAARLGACRIANIKIQRVGGFRNALRIHDACRRHGLSVWIGTMPELGVGQAQGAALATLAGVDYPTDVEASARWYVDDIIEPPLEVRDGWIALPEQPGLGYTVVAEKLNRYQVRRIELA